MPRALFVIAAAALMSGCSGLTATPRASTPTQSVAHIARTAVRSDAAGQGVREVVVANAIAAGTVTVYTPYNGQIIDTISGLDYPGGLAVDANGYIYIANTQASNAKIYSADFNQFPPLILTATLDDAGFLPYAIAVDPSSGTVALFNGGTGHREFGNVRLYAKGATDPCATVSSTKWETVHAGAFDASGNLYVTGYTGQTYLVGTVTGGCSATTIATLAIGASQLRAPEAIQITRGKIDILDADAPPVIDVYRTPPPGAMTLGAPLTSLPLGGVTGPNAFAFSQGSLYAWVADPSSGVIDDFAFPGGGSPLKTFADSNAPSGVAVVPAELP